jgi:hypothetical protein
MLLAVHEGKVMQGTAGGNSWHGTALSGPHLDWLLTDGYITSLGTDDGSPAPVTVTATGELILILLYNILPPQPGDEPDEDEVAAAAVAAGMTGKRSSALYDVRQDLITAVGARKSGKTKWASASHDLPTGSLDWLLENNLIAHDPVPARGSSPVTITPAGEAILWTVAMVPPRAVVEVSFDLYGEISTVLAAAGAGDNLRVMPVIGTDVPEVHIVGQPAADAMTELNAAGKALLEHGGFDVRVGRDGYGDIMVTVLANPAAAPRTGIAATHITDVLARSGL